MLERLLNWINEPMLRLFVRGEREHAEMRANIQSLRAALATLAEGVARFANAHDADNAAAIALAGTARAVVRHCDEVITA
jgi:hypothetical protein